MMKKSVAWNQTIGHKNPASLEARVNEHQKVVDTNLKAQNFLRKAFEPMRALLEVRLKNRTPLRVMRPLVYDSSVLAHQEEDDDFYVVKKSESALGTFVDTKIQIPVGETLLFKSLYPAMREFIFEDSKGKEHVISYDQQNLLMTQTDIYETVREFMGDLP